MSSEITSRRPVLSPEEQPSIFRPDSLGRLQGLVPGADIVLPGPSGRITNPPEGTIAVYEIQFKYGCRFPFSSFFESVLQRLNICLAQLAPNGIAHLVAFEELAESSGLQGFTEDAFFHFFGLSIGTDNWHYLRGRRGLKLFDGARLANHFWRDKFFYV